MGTSNDGAGGSTPEQYGFPYGSSELQDLIEYRDMNFAIGNIFKACYRMGTCDHSDHARDLRKIIWFAQRELDRIPPPEVTDMPSLRGLLPEVGAISGKVLPGGVNERELTFEEIERMTDTMREVRNRTFYGDGKET